VPLFIHAHTHTTGRRARAKRRPLRYSVDMRTGTHTHTRSYTFYTVLRHARTALTTSAENAARETLHDERDDWPAAEKHWRVCGESNVVYETRQGLRTIK